MTFIFPNRGLSWFNENRLSLFQIQSHYSIVPLFIQPWQTHIYWVISACSHIAIPTTKTKHRLYEWSIYFEWILSDYVKSLRYRLISEASRCLLHYSSYKTECKINMENHCRLVLFITSFENLGPDSINRSHLTSIRNPIVEIRRSYDRLISTMGFPLPVRWHLYIESGPRCCKALQDILILVFTK